MDYELIKFGKLSLLLTIMSGAKEKCEMKYLIAYFVLLAIYLVFKSLCSYG